MTIADLTGRVEAKTILLSLNSNCPSGEERIDPLSRVSGLFQVGDIFCYQQRGNLPRAVYRESASCMRMRR